MEVESRGRAGGNPKMDLITFNISINSSILKQARLNTLQSSTSNELIHLWEELWDEEYSSASYK
eukprot:scaffold4854_cov114-Skeletonema_marinoi.AAC.4